MSTSQQVPVDLIIDLHERMVRIETKLDSQAEKDAALTLAVAANTTDIAALKQEATQLRSSLSTLRWVGAALVTIVTLFGSSLAKIFS